MDVNFNLAITDPEDISFSYMEKTGLGILKLKGYDVDKGYKKDVESPKYLKVRVTAFGDSHLKMIEAANADLAAGKAVLLRITGQLDYDLATGEPRMWSGKEDGKTHASCEVTANRVSRVYHPRGKNER